MDSNIIQYVNNKHLIPVTYSKAFRGNYAGIGLTWDEDDQIFWPKKPYASWVKDTTTASWKSPIGDHPALTAEQNHKTKLELILEI